jgi:hypothetical protein
VAIVVAAAVLGLSALIATRPRISSSLVAGVAVVGAVALLAGGVVGAVAGERDIEPHEEEGVESTEETVDPAGAEGATQSTTTSTP